MLEAFDLPFVQRGLAEIALLAVGAGLLGTWIVLRGLAFYAHAVGTAAFPGLVLADGLGFAAVIGAAGTALVVAVLVVLLARRQAASYDTPTALVLVAALAAGVILASDVFETAAGVEQLLFGSLLLVDGGDIALAAAVSLAAAAATIALGPRWLATGFEDATARTDVALLALVAFAAVAALQTVGALLATALLVVPAATTRLVCDRMRTWQLATIALVLTEGITGLWLSVELNAPPGATIAVLSGTVFAVVALWTARRGLVVAAAALALLAAGCGGDEAGSDDRPQVLATTSIVADLARNVGGDAVAVRQLLRPNTDPHDYEPRPDDVRAIADADLVLASGLGLDQFVDKAADSAGGGAPVVQLGEAVARRLGQDPHWWQDPTNAMTVVLRLSGELSKAAPGQAEAIRARAGDYVRRLGALDRGIAACIEQVPRASRKLVTDHDALAYFARRYGLRVVGAVIPATTTQAQPNAGDLAQLSQLIRREDVKAVFPEEALNRRQVDAIARQTGATARYTLYGDALGPEGSMGETYIGAMAHNADQVVRGLTAGAMGCSIASH